MIQRTRWLGWAVIVMCLAACGGDDEPAGSGNAAVDSCNKVCEKTGEKMCPSPIMVTVEQCKQLCAAIVGSAPPACQAESKAEADCQLAQPDICMAEAACRTSADAGSACM